MKNRLAVLVVLLALHGVASAAGKVSLSFNNVRLPDFLRVAYAEVLKASFMLDDAVLQSPAVVSVELRGLSPEQVADRLQQVVERHGFEVQKRGGSYLVGKPSIAESSFVYVPAYRSSEWLAEVVGVAIKAGALTGRKVQGEQAKEQAPGIRDALVYSGPVKEAENVRRLLGELDTPMGEVVLKAAVFEVGMRNSEGSALSVVASLLAGHVGVSVGGVIDGVRLTVKAGGVSAVLSALGKDDRFKVVSRPQVRVRSGGAARFAVGQETPVQAAAVLDRNGNPIQSVEYRPSGIILTAKPVIRAGGVELDISQELSSYGQTTAGVLTSPTLSKRIVETSLTLQPGEVVIMAGLEETSDAEHSDRIPFFDAVLGRGVDRRKTELIVFVEAQRI